MDYCWDELGTLVEWSTSRFWNQRFKDQETPWDLGEPSPSLVELERRWSLKKGDRVFVPGCGRGNDALFFAEQGYEVTALDWSSTAVEELQDKASKRGISIQVLQGDFFSFESDAFDGWVEHTFFCAIDPNDRPRYFEKCSQLIRPGGELVGTFFLTHQDRDGVAIAKEGEVRTGPPFWTSEQYFRDLFEAKFKILECEPSPYAHSDRIHLDWWGYLQKK